MAAERDQVRTPGALTRGPRPAWQRAGLAVAAVTLGVAGAGAFLADTYATQTTCDEISGIGVAGEGYDSVKADFGRHAGLLLLHSDLRHAVKGLAADERKRQTLAAREATAETVQAALTLDDDIEKRARVAQASCNLPVVGVLFPGEEASLTAVTTAIVATPAPKPPVTKPTAAAGSSTGASTTSSTATGSRASGSAASGSPESGSPASGSPKAGGGNTTAPSATPPTAPSASPTPGPDRIAKPAPAYVASPSEIAQAQARVAEAAALYRRLLAAPEATLAQRDVALYELAAAKTHLADLEDGNPNARHPKLELWGASVYLSAAIADYRTLLTDPSATEADKTQAVAVVDYWQALLDALTGN
ncbi:hypothetical protein ACQPZJ_24995 [Actinoplanes sp. CA-054009]